MQPGRLRYKAYRSLAQCSRDGCATKLPGGLHMQPGRLRYKADRSLVAHASRVHGAGGCTTAVTKVFVVVRRDVVRYAG